MVGRTSAEWWQAIKEDPAKLEDWLIKQLRGEITAVGRLEEFCTHFVPTGHKWLKTLRLIQNQERQHAAWVKSLLENRNFSTIILDTTQRYWEQMLPQVKSFESAAAVSSYAETMRLERIRLIAEDDEAPKDIQEVFKLVLPQEIFHSKAFRVMAGEEAMREVYEAHQKGLDAIGLIPAGF